MAEFTIEELDHEICSPAARINTATARLLLLVGEFDLREGWAGHGVKSCAQWLSWNAISAPMPRESRSGLRAHCLTCRCYVPSSKLGDFRTPRSAR